MIDVSGGHLRSHPSQLSRFIIHLNWIGLDRLPGETLGLRSSLGDLLLLLELLNFGLVLVDLQVQPGDFLALLSHLILKLLQLVALLCLLIGKNDIFAINLVLILLLSLFMDTQVQLQYLSFLF